MENQSTESRRPWPISLRIAILIYTAWLIWLAYVAWVNIQAGNQ